MLAFLHFSVTCIRCIMKHYSYGCSFNYMSIYFIKIVLQYNSDYTDVKIIFYYVNMSFSVVYCIIVCNAPFCHYNQNSFLGTLLIKFFKCIHWCVKWSQIHVLCVERPLSKRVMYNGQPYQLHCAQILYGQCW